MGSIQEHSSDSGSPKIAIKKDNSKLERVVQTLQIKTIKSQDMPSSASMSNKQANDLKNIQNQVI